MSSPIRYRSADEDSGRWLQLPLRSDDIVITTRSKSGTTWMQMVCALLIFRRAELPAPLSELSPWVDWLVEPIDDVVATLEAQTHRRFFKTHTPLDGLPDRDELTYITVARHPLDTAVSLYHQSNNINRQRLRNLTASPLQDDRPALLQAEQPAPSSAEWLRSWVDWEGDYAKRLDSVPGIFHHLNLAWARRHEPNMILVHYDDLRADLPGQMRQLADQLGIEIDQQTIEHLSRAATFDQMKQQSDVLVPDRLGVLKNQQAFFRGGRSGDGSQLLGDDGMARYRRRVEDLAEPDMLAWLHRY